MPAPKDPEKYKQYIEKLKKAQQWRRDNPDNAEKNAAEKEKRRLAMQRPEVREKCSQSGKKRFANPENLAEMKTKVKDAMNRPDVREKCSQAAKEIWQRPDARANYIKAYQERWQRPGEHEKTSKATKAAMARDEVKQKMRKGMSTEEYRAAVYNAEVIAKRAISLKATWQRPEAKQRLNEAMKKLRATDAYREAVAAGQAASKKYSGTDIEIIIETLLKTLNVEYEAQKHISYWIVDFYIPSKKLVIECDGDYWHSKEEVKQRDARKDKYMETNGFNVIRLLGSAIHNGEVDALLQALNGG